MKRIISLLLCLAMLFALVGCDNSGKDTDSSKGLSSTKPTSSLDNSSEASTNGDSSNEAGSQTSVPQVNEYKKTTLNFADITDYVHVTGRTEVTTSTIETGEKRGLLYDHAGQGLLFTADCEGDVSISLALKLRKQDTHQYYTVYIDGVKQETVAVAGVSGSESIVTLPVAKGLARGVHSFEIYRHNEALLGISTLLSVTMNGTPNKWVEDTSKLKIEYLGDSITSGTGVTAVNGAADQADIKHYNATLSYAFISSRILNAEASICSRSGMTIAADTGSANMYNYYNNLSYERDQNKKFDNSKMDVDLYVISLGANDTNSKYNHSADKIKTDAKAALTAIRKDHPKAKILWVYGQLTKTKASSISDAINELGGESAGLYFYCCTKNNTQGGSYHPNAEAQQRDGEEVAAYIKTIFNLK